MLVIRNVGGLLVVVTVLYFLVARGLGFDLIPWVLTVFSVTTCIAPAIVLPLLVRRRFSPRACVVVGLGLALGCVVALVWSVLYRGSTLSVIPWNCAIGTTISLLFTLVALRMKEAPEPGRERVAA